MRYAMIEVNPTCPNRCSLCLPVVCKSGATMILDDVRLLADNLKAARVSCVTLAGFGNPVDHPHYRKVVDMIMSRLDCEITVTCRVADIDRAAYRVYRVHPSVNSIEDAKMLADYIGFHYSRTRRDVAIAPHVVLTDQNATSVGKMLGVLEPVAAEISRISFACAVVLAPHEGHINAIRKANGKRSKKAWASLTAFALRQGNKSPWHDKITIHRPDRIQTEHCQWPRSGIYINANLDVLPCCYKPMERPFGNIRETPLWRIWEQDMKRFCDGGWKSTTMCRACPDIGGRL